MKRISVLEIAELALICALMAGGKEAMNALPNIHPVTLMLIFTVLKFGWKAFFPMIGFVLFEILLYGFGMWSLTYLFTWPVITLIFCLFRKSKSIYFWAILAAASGLCFGALCEIPLIFIVGLPAAFTYWISGIPYDIIHGISNFLLTLFLLPPLLKIPVNRRLNRF